MQHWTRLLLSAAATAALITATMTAPLDAQGRGRSARENDRRALPNQQAPRSYEEPAFARGYAEGHQRGLDA